MFYDRTGSREIPNEWDVRGVSQRQIELNGASRTNAFSTRIGDSGYVIKVQSVI